MNISIEIFLLITSVLLFFSLLAGKTSSRFGVPTLLLFLAIGIGAGEKGLGLQFESPLIAQYIGVIALNIILFSGGLDTKIKDVQPVALPGILMATLGVLLTALLTGVFVYWLTNSFFSAISFSFVEALLLASIMSSVSYIGLLAR